MKVIKYQIVIMIILLSSCKDEEVDNLEFDTANGVFICNEGNFLSGNGSLSFYDPSQKTVSNNVFQGVNGFPLGDVVHSITIYGDKAYIVINNSGKIEVVNQFTFEHEGTISGLTSPREMLIINDEKAYVTDLYDNSIAIVNPSTYEKTGTLDLGTHTESIITDNQYVYVVSWRNNQQLFKIDTDTDRIVDSLDIGFQPNSLATDIHGNLWVAYDGGYQGQTNQSTPGIVKIDPREFQVESRFEPSSGSYDIFDLKINQSGAQLYFLLNSFNSPEENGVYMMNTSDASFPENPIISAGERRFYCLDIDQSNDDIYVTNPQSYTTDGRVYRYDQNAIIIDSFEVKLIPGAFGFQNN